MPAARAAGGGRAQKAAGGKVSAVRGGAADGVPGRALGARLDLPRHICSQLQHAPGKSEGTSCPSLCPNREELRGGRGWEKPAKRALFFPFRSDADHLHRRDTGHSNW
ncbi:hypothetical protein AAFF_G00374290 [Aldrovandia affinis]|uniref:Uncharacterized protein n=1 Tax=Aldrovandia affinis TaxID=143900 RepID=A0AAD7WM59_9TELE|nr:hypothetical protein AAFF_G00374290 [Aldrovandia affinis]